jgi:hypothetical protein
MDHSSVIFGNSMPHSVLRKAEKTQRDSIRKFGDDRSTPYHLALSSNPVLEDLGTALLIKGDKPLDSLPEKPVIIGNIRMGFGHYRISMAMCSAARALGCTPLWLDLNSFTDTTGGKIINNSNNLYSMGSRLSQRFGLFNKLFWEPLNSEGFRQLSYNACDQKNAELMTPVYGDFDRDVPVVATHVWPAQAAVHAGMHRVVNAIPDNWQMALHLSEGSIHTVQTPSALLGYKTLRGMDKGHILNPMPSGSLACTGHYIDHELVTNIEADCARRLARMENGRPLRWMLTVGGAGAQQELFRAIIEALMPLVKEKKAVLFINAGDHKDVLDGLCREVPDLKSGTTHSDYSEIKAFAANALDGECEGVHMFWSSDIYTAVYTTNLLMRAADVLATKPSELAFYPVPKLMIHRVGGHEAWGAIRAAELGDGTFECETVPQTVQMLQLLESDRSLLAGMNRNILKQKQIGTYDGAYHVIKLALGEEAAHD